MSTSSSFQTMFSSPLANVARRVSNPVFRCKKSGCPFYGNPAWQGYCSGCLREIQQQQQQQQQQQLLAASNSLSPSSSLYYTPPQGHAHSGSSGNPPPAAAAPHSNARLPVQHSNNAPPPSSPSPVAPSKTSAFSSVSSSPVATATATAASPSSVSSSAQSLSKSASWSSHQGQTSPLLSPGSPTSPLPSPSVPTTDESSQVSALFTEELRKSDLSEANSQKSSIEKGVEKLLKASASTRIFNILKRTKQRLAEDDKTKRQQQSPAKGHPSEIRGGAPLSPTASAATSSSPAAASASQSPPQLTFNDFLAAMKKPQAQDLVIKIKGFIENFVASDALNSEEQSESIQIFLQNLGNRISVHTLWRNAPQEELENAIDGVEKYVMTQLYPSVFSPPSTDDAAKDELLDKQISQMQWISLKHLGLENMRLNKACDEPIALAIRELRKMDGKRAPQDKVACIVKCSKTVFEILQAMAGNSHAASADEFLPVLIYTVVRAHPPRLQSNLQYISRFCNPSRLMSGEGGYFFTNMCCAVSFIENLEASSLKMDPEEFSYRMNPDLGVQSKHWMLFDALADTPSGALLQDNLKHTAALASRQGKTDSHIRELESSLGFVVDFFSELGKGVILAPTLPSELAPPPRQSQTPAKSAKMPFEPEQMSDSDFDSDTE